MTEKQTESNENSNEDRQWENAAKRKAQTRGFVLSGIVVFLSFPSTFSLVSFLSRSSRLIRKFRGKERKERGSRRRRLGLRVVTLFKTLPLLHPRDETPRCATAKHPNTNFWQHAKCRSVSREIINDRASFLRRELMCARGREAVRRNFRIVRLRRARECYSYGRFTRRLDSPSANLFAVWHFGAAKHFVRNFPYWGVTGTKLL